MKKIFLVVSLLLKLGLGFGQNSSSDQYKFGPYKFGYGELSTILVNENEALAGEIITQNFNLKRGATLLIKADNSSIASGAIDGLTLTVLMINSKYPKSGMGLLAIPFGTTSVIIKIVAKFQKREGLERIYYGVRDLEKNNPSLKKY